MKHTVTLMLFLLALVLVIRADEDVRKPRVFQGDVVVHGNLTVKGTINGSHVTAGSLTVSGQSTTQTLQVNQAVGIGTAPLPNAMLAIINFGIDISGTDQYGILQHYVTHGNPNDPTRKFRANATIIDHGATGNCDIFAITAVNRTACEMGSFISDLQTTAGGNLYTMHGVNRTANGCPDANLFGIVSDIRRQSQPDGLHFAFPFTASQGPGSMFAADSAFGFWAGSYQFIIDTHRPVAPFSITGGASFRLPAGIPAYSVQ